MDQGSTKAVRLSTSVITGRVASGPGHLVEDSCYRSGSTRPGTRPDQQPASSWQPECLLLYRHGPGSNLAARCALCCQVAGPGSVRWCLRVSSVKPGTVELRPRRPRRPPTRTRTSDSDLGSSCDLHRLRSLRSSSGLGARPLRPAAPLLSNFHKYAHQQGTRLPLAGQLEPARLAR